MNKRIDQLEMGTWVQDHTPGHMRLAGKITAHQSIEWEPCGGIPQRPMATHYWDGEHYIEVSPPVQDAPVESIIPAAIYINVYSSRLSYPYKTRAGADRGADSDLLTCVEYVPSEVAEKLERGCAIQNVELLALRVRSTELEARNKTQEQMIVRKDATISRLQSEVSSLNCKLSLVCSSGVVKGSGVI